MLLALALVAPSTVAAASGFTPSALSIARNGGVVTASATALTGDIASELPVTWLPSDGSLILQVVSPSSGRLCATSIVGDPCGSSWYSSTPSTGTPFTFLFNETGTFTLRAEAADLSLGRLIVNTAIDPVTITVEVTTGAAAAPTVSITSPTDGTTYTLGETVLADYSCSADAGLASCVGPVPSGSAIDTGTVGDHTFTVTATDDLDQTAATTVTYHVAYGFGGFLAPVPETADSATAGSSIPLRWRLTQADGSPLTNLDPAAVSVDVVSRACDLGSTEDLPFSYAGGSTLQALGDGYYRIVWKTSPTYAGSCKTLRLDLGDGVPRELEVDFVR